MNGAAHMTDDELVALGLCDEDKLDTTRPAFIRLLLERGASIADVRVALDGGGQHYLNALATEYLLKPPGTLTVDEVARAAGVSVGDVVDVWRTFGLADPRAAGPRLTERDVELVKYVNFVRELIGDDNLRDISRAFGTATAQMGEAAVMAMVRGFEQPQRGQSGGELAIQEAYGAMFPVAVPGLVETIGTLFLHGCVAALYSEVVVSDEASMQTDRTIVFVDLVDFTGLSRRTPARELSRLLAEFEEAALTEAARCNGRIVKMLGDGAMLAFATRADAIAATGALVRDYEHIPACRAGIATGPVLARNGDYFGPVVNLASRLSGAVGAGEMAIDDSGPLDGSSGVESVTLKGIDEPVAYYRLRSG